MSTSGLIEHILAKKTFAVAGVSRNPEKMGYQVYRALRDAGYEVFPINPNASEIDGAPCYPSLDNVPAKIDCLVTVTPPAVTEALTRSAGRLRVPFLWMQPGSESEAAYNTAQANSMEIISGGPCIMVALVRRKAEYAAGV